MKFLKNNSYIFLLILITVVFYWQFIFLGKLPIPADTIVGLYHPYRDAFAVSNPSGIAFKNYLVTDPVRQQYVWRKLAVNQMKSGHLPLRNPYSFAGTRLLANLQSAVFYPLNILFFLMPFPIAWSVSVLLSTFLAAFFMYLYLANLSLSKMASFLGSLIFAFSGYAIAWLEWNTILHTAAWIPLSLLSIDAIARRNIGKISGKYMFWLIFSLTVSFLAGHLQIFAYGILLAASYALFRLLQSGQKRARNLLIFTLCFLIFIILSLPQLLPTLRFMAESYRSFDQAKLNEGFYLPWQHLIQFLIPDFFGNPATGNYSGIWNYGELVGYTGVLGILLALFSLFLMRNKTVRFFSIAAVVSLFFALPTPLALIFQRLNLPLISTSKPTRLIFIIDFSLAVLSSIAFNNLSETVFSGNKNKEKAELKKILFVLNSLAVLILGFWLSLLLPKIRGLNISANAVVSIRNLILPTGIFMVSYLFLMLLFYFKNRKTRFFYLAGLIVILCADLLRFGWKFTPFSNPAYLYPETNILRILTEDNSLFRVMALDRRILPPNFSAMHGLYDIAGYDPLYLKNFGQLASAWDRQKADISPAAFNRIVTPTTYDNFLADLLNVKYLLSFTPLAELNYSLIAKEGTTYLYKKSDFFPRSFLTAGAVRVYNDQQAINEMYKLGQGLRLTAVIQENLEITPLPLDPQETADIVSYRPWEIVIGSNTKYPRLLVLSEIYDPLLTASIDGHEITTLRVDLSLTGIVVPAGEHEIIFRQKLW